MKSTQRKVSGDPIPTRREGAVFALKAFLLQTRRSVHDFFRPLPRSKPGGVFPQGVLLAQSVSRLRYAEEETARELTDGKIHNIRRAIRRLDGIVVRHGQVFSFWRYVGRLTRSKGYVPGRELREGCIIPRVGGGICQLTNAIYDAALKAGLDVVERHRHTAVIPGSLAESGRDATVFWNYIDLRLRGAQDWQLCVKMDGEHLTVSIFGSKSDAAGDESETRCAPTGLGDCSRCGRTDCYLCVTGKLRDDAHRTWLILDDEWPEFTRWRAENCEKGDRILSLRDSPAARWAGFRSKIRRRYYLWLGKREFRRAEKLSRRDGRYLYSWRKYPIPVAQQARCRTIARYFANKLTFSDTHLVVPQSLLVPLYLAGELAGRRYDVLMDALPISEIERRLDEAMARYGFEIGEGAYRATDPANPCGENGVTLGDFRAPKAMIEAEREALAGACRLISPHRRILEWAGERGVALDWILPAPVACEPKTDRPFTILLAGVALGRKGIFDLRTALRRAAFEYEVLLIPSATESRDFWQGIPVRTIRSLEAGMAQCDVVVLPAVVEHRPRGILVAMASGKPAIASSACGLPDHAAWRPADNARQLEERLAEAFVIHNS